MERLDMVNESKYFDVCGNKNINWILLNQSLFTFIIF